VTSRATVRAKQSWLRYTHRLGCFPLYNRQRGACHGLTGRRHATLVTSNLTLGAHVITANYTGDATFTLSDDSIDQVVNRATLTVTPNDNTKVYGQL